MFKLLKEKIIGSIFHRAGSVDVTSKCKKELGRKKPLSIDSKQKDLPFKVDKKAQNIEELDEITSVKGGSNPQDLLSKAEEDQLENLNHIIVSDHGSKQQQFENLLSDLDQASIKEQNFYTVVQSIQKGRQLFGNENLSYLKSSFGQIFHNENKVKVPKKNSRKKVKKVQEICAVCKEGVTKADSSQLACTHRYHKSCAIKMQWRMHYKCDLCSIRNDKPSIKFNK